MDRPQRSLRNPAPRPRFTATISATIAAAISSRPRRRSSPAGPRIRARSSSEMSTPSSRSSVSRRSVRTAGPSIARKRAGEARRADVVLVAQEVVGHHTTCVRASTGAPRRPCRDAPRAGPRPWEALGSGTRAGRPRRWGSTRGSRRLRRGARRRARPQISRRSGGSSTSTNARVCPRTSGSVRTSLCSASRSSRAASRATRSRDSSPSDRSTRRPASRGCGCPVRRGNVRVQHGHHRDQSLLLEGHAECAGHLGGLVGRLDEQLDAPLQPGPQPQTASSSAVRSNETMRATPSRITIFATSATSFSRQPPEMFPTARPPPARAGALLVDGRSSRSPRRSSRARACARAPTGIRSPTARR